MMKCEMFSLGFGTCIVLFAVHAVHAVQAQGASCADHDMIIGQLSHDFGERQQMAGLSAGGQLVELYGAEETGTWTIIVTDPTGTTCLLSSGDYFQRSDDEFTSGAKGDPA